MTALAHRFEDGAAYEHFMGRWTHSAGVAFLDWVGSPDNSRWLDVGCGGDVFTELILDRCAPNSVDAVDPAQAQIEHARQLPRGQRARFRVADAEVLPFVDATFDVVASALVLNFIPDPLRALSEMRRVARGDGIVAGYVWDFSRELSPSWPLRTGLRAIGFHVPEVPGTEHSDLEILKSLFVQSHFECVAVRSIEASVAFADFDAYWRSQTSIDTPIGKIVGALNESDRGRLINAVRAELPTKPDGSFAYSARANAVKARVRK